MLLTTAAVAAPYLPVVGTFANPADRSASCSRRTAFPLSPFWRLGFVPCDSSAPHARLPPMSRGLRPTDSRNLANSRASAAENRPLTVVAKPALCRRHSIAFAWAPLEPCLIGLYVLKVRSHLVADSAGIVLTATVAANASAITRHAAVFRILPMRWIPPE